MCTKTRHLPLPRGHCSGVSRANPENAQNGLDIMGLAGGSKHVLEDHRLSVCYVWLGKSVFRGSLVCFWCVFRVVLVCFGVFFAVFLCVLFVRVFYVDGRICVPASKIFFLNI
jgi:hypothetical protein